MTTEEKIKVMQGYVDGKQIQVRYRQYYMVSEWSDCTSVPTWDWSTREYRIKPQPTNLEVANKVWEETFGIKNAFDDDSCAFSNISCQHCPAYVNKTCNKKQWWNKFYEKANCEGE